MTESDSTALRTASRQPGQSAHRVNTSEHPGHSIDPYGLEFSGRGGEFVRVWIVNVLLTVVTLGFYTPFARRRTAQYFYSHTLVADSPLEFTAHNRGMVLGFLLMVLVYATFKLAADTGQDAAVSLLLLAGAVLAPYLWASAMRFRLASTRWRGVRLQFNAGWGEVYKASWPVFAMALAWMAVAASLGALPKPLAPWALLLPLAALVASLLCVIRLEFNYKSLLVLRARVGSHHGRWKPVYSDFLRIWLATLGVFLAGVLLVGALVGLAVGGSLSLLDGMRGKGLAAMLAIAAAVVGAVLGLFFVSAPARAYREARKHQLVWNNVGVSHIARFRCDLRAGAYVWLRVKNMVLSLLTLGFYRPFAMVSEYRMKVESVTLHVKGGVDQLAGQLVEQQGGFGDAVADAVGLGLVG